MHANGRRSVLTVIAVAATATVSLSPSAARAEVSRAAADSAQVYVVQAVPRADVDVSIDGKSVGTGVATKEIVGPLQLSQGRHRVSFTTDSWSIGTSFKVRSPSIDVVLHWPADKGDQPVVTVFRNDVAPVSSGKGRLTVAHTAVVPPADIRVDGKVLFANIANGEFVTATVPATTYSVEVVPTGAKGHALLGPVDLSVKPGALTRVFAIGEPKNNSMDAIVQVLDVSGAGSAAPSSVDAGEAGLVATNLPAGSADGSALVGVALVGGAGLVMTWLVLRRRPARP